MNHKPLYNIPSLVSDLEGNTISESSNNVINSFEKDTKNSSWERTVLTEHRCELFGEN